MGLKHKPTINGKEVDLNLLYQIVTSHGGWEKVNTRNEWDDLLEHFHLPRGTNGGLVIKQIYLKYLETYEKIYFSGENVGGHKEDLDDFEFEDIRNRRRHHAHKVSSRSQSNSHIQGSANQQQNPQQQQNQVPLSDQMREQLGLPKNPGASEYERLLLSLQSPLPNEQDMAISVCTLLSNETKHVLKFEKCPHLLNWLLAHAGIYEHCGMRELVEETYKEGREMNLKEFWDDIVQQADIRPLLCESYVDQLKSSTEEEYAESAILELEDDYQQVDDMELGEEGGDSSNSNSNSTPMASQQPQKPKEKEPTEEYLKFTECTEEKETCDSEVKACCTLCPCFSQKKKELLESTTTDSEKSQRLSDENFSFPSCMTRTAGSEDKVGQRVHQIAFLLRNLSFEEDNASVMATNLNLLRYLLITSNCSWGNLPQMSFDILGNIAGHIILQDPLKDPITSMLLALVTSGLFSTDRFRVLRSLEVIRDLSKTERNEKLLARYMEKKVYTRMCELLTICDIMLLIYTLECILSMTGIGEAVCNELVRVKGSVATLVSLVTVEAQSYGPKGCILMRVVETVTGGSQTHSTNSTQAPPISSSSLSPMTSPIPSSSATLQQPSSQTTVVTHSHVANSIPAIGLRTVSSHTVIPPPPLSNQQQQTGSSTNNLPSTTTNSNPNSSLNLGAVNMLNINSPLQQQQFRTLVRIPSSGSTSIITPSQPIQGGQQPTISASLQQQQQVHRPSSPVGTSLAPVAQVQGKHGSLPIMVNHLSSTPIGNSVTMSNNLAAGKSVTPVVLFPTVSSSSSNSNTPTVNNINCVHNGTASTSTTTTTGAGATPVVGGLAQVSSQSLTQHVFAPCLNLVSQKGSITEGAWATAWLNDGFETSTGSSIEMDKFYSLYCSARKNPTVVLSMEQLIQCAKNVYGASVGPVMKTFGSTSLTFIEGIRPKITLRPAGSAGAVSVPVSNNNSIAVVSSSQTVTTNSGIQQSAVVALTTNGVGSSVNQINSTGGGARPTSPAQLPVSVHIPGPLSPILKATLSRPPTTKTPAGAKRGKAVKLKEKRANRPVLSPSIKKNKRKTEPQQHVVSKAQASNKIMSPASSAIRSLLASKVAQRQQKKLQQQQTKNSKKGNSAAGVKTAGKGKVNQIKMNGIDTGSEKGEESSASSSMNSTEESDVKTDSSILNFQGVICNGVNTIQVESHKGEEELLEAEVVGVDDLGKNSRVKGMLVDLLERKVSHIKDPVNGIVGREIRISEKGLELIEKQQNSTTGANLLNNTLGQGGDSQEPQQMTFYASTPELGLKRVASSAPIAAEQSSTTEGMDHQAPPAKRPAYCMNGSDVPSSVIPQSTSNVTNSTAAGSTTSVSSSSVLQAALTLSSASTSIVTTTTNANTCSTTLDAGKMTVSTKTNNNQMVHLPVRLSVNPQNPQHLTFSSRQMLIQPGQQFLLSTNSQTGMSGIQGQVIISKPQGSTGDSITKAILVIQTPNQQQQQPQQQTHPQVTQVSQSLPLLQGQSHIKSAIVAPPTSMQSPINQMVYKREGVHPSAYSHIPMEQLEQDLPYLCEWAGCSLRFCKYQQVFMHAISAHCPEDSTQDAIRCEWGANGCDPLLRKRYSVMTHLQDRHCSKQALELACYRRKNKIEPPPPPQQPLNYPGYAPNAAFHAIKRHALQFLNPKEMMDENEGPVTKSIRLTSALILRNLVNYSSLGRKIIGGYESQLSAIAMSNVESSRTIAQLLHDMSEAAPS